MLKFRVLSIDRSEINIMPWDQLFLLEQPFSDPAFPGQQFYCWQCSLLEGVLSALPSCAARLDVRQIAWAKPRAALIERLGQDHQSAPVLIFEKGSPAPENAKYANGFRLCRRSVCNPLSFSCAPRISGRSFVKCLPCKPLMAINGLTPAVTQRGTSLDWPVRPLELRLENAIAGHPG
ncbi:DUF3088 family protein [Bradyrhizobium sp. UFLA05-153]